MASWEEEEEKKGGLTRREWVKFGMALGTVAAIGGLGGLVTGQLLPPPITASGTVSQEIRYTKFPTPQWWNARDGQLVKPTDFQVWQGATGVFQGIYQNNVLVPGTGFPVLIIRLPYDSQYFVHPSDDQLSSSNVLPMPDGFSLYYDDPVNQILLVVAYDRCVHLCCQPGWHVVTSPSPGRDYGTYGASPPTYEQYHEDPIYCVCHGSQYDPMLLVINTNPHDQSAPYVGAERVHGPAARALPLIPVQFKGGSLTGGISDPRWYVYC